MNENKSSDKVDKTKMKFNNGWTHELEVLIADWADRSQCYRWMHDKSSQELGKYNQRMMIPVIILSTLSGAANFSLNTIFPDPTSTAKTYATLGIGSISIITGIISTLANFFRYAQLSEAHSTGAIAWAKFARLIIIELSLHPNERTDAFTFLKMFRVELDRLIEQSPPIPEFIVKRFQKEFDTKLDIKRPDITGDIKHTAVYDNRTERLKIVASEAALTLMHKKKLMKDLVMIDIDRHINEVIDHRAHSILQLRRSSIPLNNVYIPEVKHSFVPKPNTNVNKIARSFVPTNNEPNPKNIISELKQVFNKNKEVNNVVETNTNIIKTSVPVIPVNPEPKIEASVPVIPEVPVPEIKTEDVVEKNIVTNTDLQVVINSEIPDTNESKP